MVRVKCDGNYFDVAIKRHRVGYNQVAILKDGKEVDAIGGPDDYSPRTSCEAAQGFSLDQLAKEQKGFSVGFEWGSRFYLRKKLLFECINAEFALVQIETEYFDKHDPKHSGDSSKKKVNPVAFGQVDLAEMMKDWRPQ